MPVRNLLLIVLDQFRADLLDGGLAKVAPTPNLDEFAKGAMWYKNHHTVTVPCGPSRASLLTGQYASNHKSMFNGAPLGAHHPTLATELRKLGREPLLFGYTDTQPDPAGRAPLDPANRSYTAPMAGFTEVLEMRDEAWAWLAYLRAKGYDVPDAETDDMPRLYRPQTGALGGPALYDAADSDTAFLTDQVIAQLDVRKAKPWSALVTYIRPHPPFVAPAPYHDLVDPADIPAPSAQPFDHPFFSAFHAEPSVAGMFWGFDGHQRNLSPEIIAKVRATYLGLVAEVDTHVGRVLEWLEASGQQDETLVVITADHGEMLGDFGLWGKQTPFRQASHVPLMIRVPGEQPGIELHPTQSIDVVPTLLSYLGATPSLSMDGSPLPPHDKEPSALIELELGSEPGPNRFNQNRTGVSRAVALETLDFRLIEFANGMVPMLFSVPDNAPVSNDAQINEMRDKLLHRLMSAR